MLPPAPFVSLVIPCLNGARTARAVMEGVRGQSLAPGQVLVVDDGSTDQTAALFAELGAEVISHPRNLGLSAARNTGLRAAQGELVAFLDADAVPHPDLLSRLCRGFEDPSLAGVGGQILELAPGTLPDRWRAAFWRQTLGARPLSEAPFLVGGCCCLRRSAALGAGGFADTFRTNGEDVDLSVRLRHRGFRLAYDPLAQVVHLRRDTAKTLLSMIFRHSRDHVRALRRHGEPAWPVVRAALRWGPVTVASSLRRHGSPSLAALSPVCSAASLAGCLRGLLPVGRFSSSKP